MRTREQESERERGREREQESERASERAREREVKKQIKAKRQARAREARESERAKQQLSSERPSRPAAEPRRDDARLPRPRPGAHEPLGLGLGACGVGLRRLRPPEAVPDRLSALCRRPAPRRPGLLGLLLLGLPPRPQEVEVGARAPVLAVRRPRRGGGLRRRVRAVGGDVGERRRGGVGRERERAAAQAQGHSARRRQRRRRFSSSSFSLCSFLLSLFFFLLSLFSFLLVLLAEVIWT